MSDRVWRDETNEYDGVQTALSTFSTFITGLTNSSTTIRVHECDSDFEGRLVFNIQSVWSTGLGQNSPPVPWLAFKCDDDGIVHYLLALKMHGCKCEGMPKDNIRIRKIASCGYGSPFESDAISALNRNFP